MNKIQDYIINGGIGIILLSGAIQDLRTKKVSNRIIILGVILLCVCIPFSKTLNVWDRILGLMIGMIVILISKATKGKIGMGDGLLLCITGLGFGFWGNLEVFALALFAAAILSIFLLLFRLADRKKTIPFIPFLFLGYLMTIIPQICVI